jgi:hypothetical protein
MGFPFSQVKIEVMLPVAQRPVVLRCGGRGDADRCK